ncbi:MAG: twin-arginine translocase subunit TatB [Nitrosomonadales bacterium]|nr:twin-arginine translocase subunit TatB [Nitrosomonadales bacterium]
MFDIGFSEMVVIAVVALIVIGPERLPKVARTLGHLWGRGQRYVNGVKADIARDMAIDEFRQLQQQVQQEADNAGRAVKQVMQAADEQVQQLNEAVAKSAHTAAPTPPPITPQPAAAAPEQAQLELQPPPPTEKDSANR